MLGEALKVEVNASPVRGAANQAVIALLAELLDVPRGTIVLLSGHGGRAKVVEVRGLDAATIAARLAGV